MTARISVVPDSRFMTRTRPYSDVFEPRYRTAAYVAGDNVSARLTLFLQVSVGEFAKEIRILSPDP